jgi:hypothetical protein
MNQMNTLTADLELKQIFDELSKKPSYNLVYIDDGNTLIKAMPMNVHNTNKLILPETLNIGEQAFVGNRILCTIILPEGLKTISPCAFYNCSNLYSINIPTSVTSIGEMAFYGCTNLKSITILDGTHIGENAFYKSGLDMKK